MPERRRLIGAGRQLRGADSPLARDLARDLVELAPPLPVKAMRTSGSPVSEARSACVPSSFRSPPPISGTGFLASGLVCLKR